MTLLKNTKLYSLLGLAFLLCSCSSVVFPDVVDESTATPGVSKQGLREGHSLGSDEVNVLYDDEQTMDKYAETITPAKTIPVKKEHVEKPVSKYEVATSSQEDVKAEKQIGYDQKNFGPSMTFLADTLYFRNGSAFVGQEHSSQIKKIAKLAKDNDAQVTVLGYASSRTGNTDIVSHKLANFQVSMDRAENVAKALRRAGVPAKNISIEALSDSNPAYLEVMPEGERLNRRAEVYLSY